MSPDLFWIPGPWRGRLAIVTRPRGGDWLDDEISGLRQSGIDVMISLLELDEAAQLNLAAEREVAEAHNIRYVSFPVPDRGVPASLPAFFSLMSRVSSVLDEGKNVAVHCRQGIGRSGLIAAGILATSGMHPDEAIKIVSTARRLAVPETMDQRLWVEQLPTNPSVVIR
jgi:protein-tyrosine phosphatase